MADPFKNVTVSVTNSNPNFTVTAGNMADLVVGDIIVVRDPTRGSMVHQIVSTNVAAKTGVFYPSYIGATQTGLFAMLIPASDIDPATDTVIKTELIAQITDAFARDQANNANWTQLLTVPTGNVTLTLSDGTKVTGPSWQSILSAVIQKDVAGQVINQGLSINGSFVMNDTTAKPANLDCGGFSRFRKGGTFDAGLNSLGDITVNPPENAFASVRATQTMTAATGEVSGPNLSSSLISEGGNRTQITMSLRKQIGSTDFGLISYQDFRGDWHEMRIQNNGDINNLTGNWVTGSDHRIKDKIEVVADPIALIRGLELYTYERDGVPGIGGIAQEIEQNLPMLVREGGSFKLKSGPVVDRVKSVDYMTIGYIAAIALNKALDRVEVLEAKVAALEALEERVKALEDAAKPAVLPAEE